MTLGKQITINETNEIQILVLDDPDKEYIVTLQYNGEIKKVSSKEVENLSFASKLFNFGKKKFMVYIMDLLLVI